MRALPHAPDSSPCETGTDFHDRPQGRSRDELDLGRPMDVDELNQQILDAVSLKSSFELGKLFIEI
jgi:hypothetical protein